MVINQRAKKTIEMVNRLLLAIAKNKEKLSEIELAEKANLPRTTTRRLTKAMVNEGLLTMEKDIRGRGRPARLSKLTDFGLFYVLDLPELEDDEEFKEMTYQKFMSQIVGDVSIIKLLFDLSKTTPSLYKELKETVLDIFRERSNLYKRTLHGDINAEDLMRLSDYEKLNFIMEWATIIISKTPDSIKLLIGKEGATILAKDRKDLLGLLRDFQKEYEAYKKIYDNGLKNIRKIIHMLEKGAVITRYNDNVERNIHTIR